MMHQVFLHQKKTVRDTSQKLLRDCEATKKAVNEFNEEFLRVGSSKTPDKEALKNITVPQPDIYIASARADKAYPLVFTLNTNAFVSI